jgi:hypothetical protein
MSRKKSLHSGNFSAEQLDFIKNILFYISINVQAEIFLSDTAYNLLRVSPSACLPVCPRVTCRLPLDGFPWNLISVTICRANPNVVEIEQRYWVFYVKTYRNSIVAGDLNSP